ncbi:MAG: hypothetical protein K1060chlam1_00234 [Candidatus Anoxychlamydiales bacterium]|nr:hypothetical protein [Candidatus Anoxychlamydiales bacterium]
MSSSSSFSSFSSVSATLPYEDSFENTQNSLSQNGSCLDINEMLHNLPPSFALLTQKQSSMKLAELNSLIEFIINHLNNNENCFLFIFFDQALNYAINNEVNKAKDVLRFQIALSKLKLYLFFHDSESASIILKINDRVKGPERLINFITSTINTNFNPTLSDVEYMPIYECLIYLEDSAFKAFFQRCLYGLSFSQTSLHNDLKKEFCEKGFALQGHGMGYSKRGLRNLANLILEGKLRDIINIGPIGKPEAIPLKDFTCAAHGPFYLLVKDNADEIYLQKEHLAYIVPEVIDKELLISIITIAFIKGILSEEQKKLNIARIFTIQEFLNLPDKTLSSDQLEKFIHIKIIK